MLKRRPGGADANALANAPANSEVKPKEPGVQQAEKSTKVEAPVSTYRTVIKALDLETDKRRSRFGGLLVDKNSRNPEDDPEYICCHNLKVHFVVLIMAVFFAVTAFGGGIERIYTFCVQKKTPNSGYQILVFASMLFLISVANGVLFVGNRLRMKTLYYVYFGLLVSSLLVIMYYLVEHMQHTVHVLLLDPREIGTEKQIWKAYKWALPRLVKAGFTIMMVIFHVMITFYVYRDYCFVLAYPRRFQFKKNNKY
ncbi:unnamed protein product [Bursaphelenchus okinawaensis]|uniref:Uncharacterized protein n=1 Tax=Bursaphelenchus okinawaensis TaxID=465554 RepID=A0A811LIL4_9BILA|nr:unnamed protein product [Bursaphelenchus okinawaensis]CAG9124049.1 unnamed protein product [Bursaphelenchus okinawaensis]